VGNNWVSGISRLLGRQNCSPRRAPMTHATADHLIPAASDAASPPVVVYDLPT